MLVGILNVKSHCVVGNGVVVHLRGLLNELKTLREAEIDYKGNQRTNFLCFYFCFFLTSFHRYLLIFTPLSILLLVYFILQRCVIWSYIDNFNLCFISVSLIC